MAAPVRQRSGTDPPAHHPSSAPQPKAILSPRSRWLPYLIQNECVCRLPINNYRPMSHIAIARLPGRVCRIHPDYFGCQVACMQNAIRLSTCMHAGCMCGVSLLPCSGGIWNNVMRELVRGGMRQESWASGFEVADASIDLEVPLVTQQRRRVDSMLEELPERRPS
jgi:hypothetical protein